MIFISNKKDASKYIIIEPEEIQDLCVGLQKVVAAALDLTATGQKEQKRPALFHGTILTVLRGIPGYSYLPQSFTLICIGVPAAIAFMSRRLKS